MMCNHIKHEDQTRNISELSKIMAISGEKKILALFIEFVTFLHYMYVKCLL
jgi:hypothetical protein